MAADTPFGPCVDLTWANNGNNLGDLLSPVIVAALTGRRIRHRGPLSPRTRLVAIGTSGQDQRMGHVHIWGTGFEGIGSQSFSAQKALSQWRLGHFIPHATRGPFSARLLESAGYGAPAAFGDPATLLPRIWSFEAPKKWELGVVLHMSELAALTPGAAPNPEFIRYRIPENLQGHVCIISPLVKNNVAAIKAKVGEILSCRRVLSTSLHGLVIAESYGIACATFDIHGGANGRFAASDTSTALDHRMRDFYAGTDSPNILVYHTPRHLQTDWDRAIAFLDHEWRPLQYNSQPLLDAFPRQFGETGKPITDTGMLEKLICGGSLRA
jgi:pyruvyltransferase